MSHRPSPLSLRTMWIQRWISPRSLQACWLWITCCILPDTTRTPTSGWACTCVCRSFLSRHTNALCSATYVVLYCSRHLDWPLSTKPSSLQLIHLFVFSRTFLHYLSAKTASHKVAQSKRWDPEQWLWTVITFFWWSKGFYTGVI